VFHLLLLVLAVLLTWETVKAVLPFRLPSLVHTGLVLALAYGWTLMPYTWLTLAAVTSSVGILHHLVGTTDSKPAFAFPRKAKARTRPNRVPDLP